jgi:hypothetical protein
MGVVHEHETTTSAAVLAIFLIALVAMLAILFYGLTVGHWFGPSSVNVNVSTPPSPGGSIGPSFTPAPSR